MNTADGTRKVPPAANFLSPVARDPSLPLGMTPRCSSLRGATRGVLRRNADDEDARSTRDVHRIDDVAVLRVRIALHEQDLVGTVVVDRVELGRQLRLGDFLGVDEVLP